MDDARPVVRRLHHNLVPVAGSPGIEGQLITGGLPGLVHVDDIYRLTYERTAARNRAYFRRHPGDERTVRELCAHLADTEETLPTGERSPPRVCA